MRYIDAALFRFYWLLALDIGGIINHVNCCLFFCVLFFAFACWTSMLCSVAILVDMMTWLCCFRTVKMVLPHIQFTITASNILSPSLAQSLSVSNNNSRSQSCKYTSLYSVIESNCSMTAACRGINSIQLKAQSNVQSPTMRRISDPQMIETSHIHLGRMTRQNFEHCQNVAFDVDVNRTWCQHVCQHQLPQEKKLTTKPISTSTLSTNSTASLTENVANSVDVPHVKLVSNQRTRSATRKLSSTNISENATMYALPVQVTDKMRTSKFVTHIMVPCCSPAWPLTIASSGCDSIQSSSIISMSEQANNSHISKSRLQRQWSQQSAREQDVSPSATGTSAMLIFESVSDTDTEYQMDEDTKENVDVCLNHSFDEPVQSSLGPRLSPSTTQSTLSNVSSKQHIPFKSILKTSLYEVDRLLLFSAPSVSCFNVINNDDNTFFMNIIFTRMSNQFCCLIIDNNFDTWNTYQCLI